MAKTAAKPLSESEWNSFVKEILKSLATTALPERGDNARAAKALGVHKSTIEQMKSQGKGSLVTWFQLLAHHADLSPDDIRAFFKNYPSLIKNISPLSDVDLLFEEAKKKYAPQELAAWLKLLLSKSEVEAFVGVDVKATLKKRAKKN